MNKYHQQSDGSYLIDGMTIPNCSGNRHHQQMIEEVDGGIAEIVPYVEPSISDVDLAINVRADRDARIESVQWRFERYARHARLGLDQIDDLSLLDSHVQALADISQQSNFPHEIDWPELQGG